MDKKRRYVSRSSAAGRVFSLRSTFTQVGLDGEKLAVGNPSHIDNICPRRARFRRDGLKGEGPMASPKRSDRRGSSDRGKRAPDWEAPRLFFVSVSYEKFDPCRRVGPRRSNLRLCAFPAVASCELAVAPSPLRPYASSLRPEASMLSSSASAPFLVSSFANT